jgi:hypothetical protein
MLVSLFQGVLRYGKHRTIRQEGSELLGQHARNVTVTTFALP